ncbi:hypothetical protein [Photobacterium sp. 1_MG-2023]|uniref:hypothetical protein n=1 Tax=Photobacterium sp. 1_MG-2023 TaxID=3062646 RepID=UPI0026E27435|nr:hypothetical protein [Photobacterium sp. 1_MG-2023]MDO6705341.1 hypothetical protein [Photobacterium sp. 1_MG-2023]
MAAQKLTKARLIQILFLLAVLITAFTWRTITYDQSEVTDEIAVNCQSDTGDCVDLSVNRQNEMRLFSLADKGGNQYRLVLPMSLGNMEASLISARNRESVTKIVLDTSNSFKIGDFSLPANAKNTSGYSVKVETEKMIYILSF